MKCAPDSPLFLELFDNPLHFSYCHQQELETLQKNLTNPIMWESDNILNIPAVSFGLFLAPTP